MNSKTIALAALLLIAAGCTTQKKEEAAAPTTRPSLAPVLGENTVAAHDIAYGADKKFQSLDIYSPRDAKDAPVIIFVHGGGWTRSDKEEVSQKPKWLNANGIVFVSVNYRLSPAVMHPENVKDVALATAWVRDNIAKHGGSPKKIFLMGHSAGSQLAALAPMHPGAIKAAKLSSADVAGVISLDGSAFDIPDRIEKGAPSIAENCRRTFGTDLAMQRDGSPQFHVKKGLPPFLLFYVKEGALNHNQSQAIADALKKEGVAATVMKSTAADHFSIDHELGSPGDPASAAIIDFVKTGKLK